MMTAAMAFVAFVVVVVATAVAIIGALLT